MSKTIYIVDPTTRELLGSAVAPVDPVASELAGKLIFAEVNSVNATEATPPEHVHEDDDVRWLGAKGWQVDKGAKAKRRETELAATQEIEEQTKADQRTEALAGMTKSEKKLFLLREENPDEFDASEREQDHQDREKKAKARLERHEKRRTNSAKATT